MTQKAGFAPDSAHFDKHYEKPFDLIYCCGRQKEPAILISTLLLQTHAPQLCSLVLTRFCRNLESSTTNASNAKNAIFSPASRVTFGPWITWRSCIAAALTNPNRACQLGFHFSQCSCCRVVWHFPAVLFSFNRAFSICNNQLFCLNFYSMIV